MWDEMVRIGVLGPFEAEVSGSAVPLGGPRQRAVLALLVSARGEVVSVDRMIDDLWRGEPPPQAIASLQAYVSNLRRLLEPGRSRRARAQVLVSAPPGYAIRLPDDAIDAWRFERLLRQAREAGASDPARAKTLLHEALSLWRGAAFAEAADEPWAVAEVARLEELRLIARELLVAMTLRSGTAAEAVPAADGLTRLQPLREEGWRLLALALWASDRRADALAAVRRARRTLTDELGLDPGPALIELESAILNQRLDVLYASAPRPDERRPPSPLTATPHPSSGPNRSSDPGIAGRARELFVGRDAELSSLTRIAAEAAAGSPCIALVTGEAGVGKSALLARLHEDLEREGWLVAVGRCPEAEGAPPAWAWFEALRFLSGSVPPGEFTEPLAPLLGEAMPERGADAAAGRFRLHQAVIGWLRVAAGQRPLAIVLDDLHRGDDETLTLLAGVAEELTGVPLLLVAAFRPDEPSERLTEALAALARCSPHRLPLAGLSAAAVEHLVSAVTPADHETVAVLAERTGGNPFYVRESARLLASEGALVATSEVPEGVRDVLRRRLARLPDPAVAVLRLAAVVGREAEVEVLAEAADTDETGVFDALEAGLIAGLLTEPAPGRVRFVHALVRDTLVQDLSQLRRMRMHARVAEALERLHPDDLSALAHHYARAASAATASRAVDYSVRAASLAERRYAHDAAADLLTQALDSFERVPGEVGDPDARRVELLGMLLRAQIRAGAVSAARATRERAAQVAERAGRDDLLVAAFTAWTEPTPWQTRPYGYLDEHAVGLLTRLLRDDGLDPVTRCRLLDAFTAELDGEADPRARAAATEAVALAERIGDPALRALTLASRTREVDFEREWELRDTLGTELTRLGAEHDLPAYRWYGGFIAATAAAAQGDLAMTRRRLAEGLELARTYRMPEPGDVHVCAEAMFAHVEGRFEESERLYTEATERMMRRGSLHAGAFRTLALVTLRISQGRIAEYAPVAEELYGLYGPLVADVAAVMLTAEGRAGEARGLRTTLPPLRTDYFFSVFATLRAMAVVALGELDRAQEAYDSLLRIRDQLPGAPSLSLAMRPVEHSLGDLAVLLGRPAEASGHFARAITVAERWGSPHWAADARSALDATRLSPP
ncbi:MAG: putative LuxR-family transcriptional regulator [Actinomycetia bacterium]|nr:putative LuxR-family transcriptional regulator [Actinomycetes bacterium]